VARPAMTPALMRRVSRQLGPLRPDTCLVKREARIKDAGGQQARGVFGTVGVHECRLDETPGAAMRIFGAVLQGEMSGIISFLLGVDVRDGDDVEVHGKGRFRVGGVGSNSSFQFETIALVARRQ